MSVMYYDPDSAALRAVEILQAKGIPCYHERFQDAIMIEDDGCWWHWGTNNDTWGADLVRDLAEGDDIGCAVTDVPSDSDDAEAIAAAILAALNHGTGVEFWRD